MNLTHPLEALRHHVTGAIERGEAEAVTEVTASATHYVPVERKALPASDPLRWFIVEVETADPVAAMTEASRQVREDMRLKGATIWAAVRDIPSFAYMQMLRESMGKASKRGAKSIPGYC